MGKPIFTVRDPHLSRWQSTVESLLRKEFPEKNIAQIRNMPMIQGNWKHVAAAFNGEKIAPPATESADSVDFHAYASQQFLAAVEKLPPGLHPTPPMILSSVDDWPYSTDNMHKWIEAAITQYGTEIFIPKDNQYTDVPYIKNTTNLDFDFGIIEWTLPADAKIVIIGDWGTSCLDAEELLRALLAECGTGTPPDCIIHLGDIYYAGTMDECDSNFYDVIRTTLGYTGPVFTIPGNHEYYSWGEGYYNLIKKLNTSINGKSTTQAASYFCLRTADNSWQFLGLDTGYNDSSQWDTKFSPPAPDLKSANDVSWAQDKLNNFAGKTIMLTHHQLFTRSADPMESDAFGKNCANPYLYSYFNGHFWDKIAAWFWGHEHSFAMFQNGLLGLNMGRLLGSSSYEEAKSDKPYANNYPLIPYNSNNVIVKPNSYKPTSHDSDQYYPHVGAIMQLDGSNAPEITYYSFPSWDKKYSEPSGMTLTNLVSETITNPSSLPTGIWRNNKHISYNTDNGPGLAFYDDTIYIVFQNKDDSSIIYWDNPSYSGGKLNKNSPAAISPKNTSSPTTDKNPALVNYNGTLLMVYKTKGATDLRWCTFDPSTQKWTGQGKIEDAISSSPNIQSNYGPALTVFNGKVYLLYLNDGDDLTVYWATYDSTNGWVNHGSKTLLGLTSSNYNLQSGHHVCPAVAANDDNLFIVFNNGDNLGWVMGDKSDNWTFQSLVSNDNLHSKSFIPSSQLGLALSADSDSLHLYYIDSDVNNSICWATYSFSDQLWVGGIPTMVTTTILPQSACAPAVCEGATFTIMVYRGSDNHSVYYSAKDNL